MGWCLQIRHENSLDALPMPLWLLSSDALAIAQGHSFCGCSPMGFQPCSTLGEKIDWMEAVDPSLTGAVELWMGEVEGVIRRTLHKLAGLALAAYATTQRSKWILEWPGQLVLNCSQVCPALVWSPYCACHYPRVSLSCWSLLAVFLISAHLRCAESSCIAAISEPTAHSVVTSAV